MSRSVRLAWIALSLLSMGYFGSAAQSQEPKWQRDYSAARAEARETNRPLLLDFGTEHCMWCVKLDATFRNPAIAKLVNENFIPVKIDAERLPKLAQAAGVQSYPTLVLVRPDGTIAARREGYADAGELSQFLKASRLAGAPAATPHAGPETDEDVIHCRVTVVGGRDGADSFRPARPGSDR